MNPVLLPLHGRQMFLEKLPQVAAGQIVGGAELQADRVEVGPPAVQFRIVAQVGDLSQGEAALGTHQVQVHGVELLGLHGRPGLVLLGHVDRHHLLVVPEELPLRRDLGQQLHEVLQHLGVPLDRLAQRKALAGEVPLAAELFPGLQDVGLLLHLLGELAEAGHRPVDELPELRAIDLRVAVDAQLDLLPRPAEVPAPHPRLGAVERQLGHVVQRLQVELLDQFLPVERVPGRAELHLQQPLLAGDGVEEPAVRFLRPRESRPRSASSSRYRRKRVGAFWESAPSPCAPLDADRSTSARMRPSQRQGLPVRPTRSTVCQCRPSISQGMRASRPTSVMSRSPFCCGHFGGKVEELSLGEGARRPAPGPGPRQCTNAGMTDEAREATGAFVRALDPRSRLRIVHDDLLRRAGGDHVAALLARLGPEVDHPIGRLDHIQVVLDHDHRVAQIDQPIEHVEQLGQVVEVQAGGRLVQRYSVRPVSGRESSAASFTRCASPPESVGAGWPSVT